MNRLKRMYLVFAFVFVILGIATLTWINRFTYTWIGYVLLSTCIGVVLCCGILHYISFIKKYDLTIVGQINAADGIGGHSINQYRLLKRLGHINLMAISVKRYGLTFVEKILVRIPFFKFGKVIFFHDYNAHQPHKPCLSILFNPKNRFRKRFALPNPEKHLLLIYSMIESTELSSYMVDYMNTCFDAVVVPDPFLIELYKNHGVRKPIFCLPLIINYRNIHQPIKKSASEIFTFLNLSATYYRKNTAKLVEAFLLTFKDNDKVKLVINSRTCAESELTKIKAVLEKVSEKERTKVNHTQKVLTEDEFDTLLRSADCYVSPSKGEGFSIIPREAMIMGIPCIVTNNTGQTTIAQSGLTEVVKSEILCPALHEHSDKTIVLGNQFDCTTEDLAQAMINVYNNYQTYLNKSQQMRDWALQYTFDNLRPIHDHFLIHPQHITLGNKNELTPNSITTDSPEFYKKYKRLFNLS